MTNETKTTGRRRRSSPTRPGALVIGGSADARRRAEARRPARLSTAQVQAVLSELGGAYTTKNHVGEPHVTLSARHPWVEDRGYLNAVNPQSFFADGDSFGFIAPFDSNVEGEIEVWLSGLQPGGTYFVELRVGSYPLDPDQPGQWEVRSSAGSPSQQQATGPDQNVLAVFEADGPLALVKLTSTGLGGWVFHDVRVALVT